MIYYYFSLNQKNQKHTQPENLSDFISHTKPREGFCLRGLMVTLQFSYYIQNLS